MWKKPAAYARNERSKKLLRGFRDLQIYQLGMRNSVEILKSVLPLIAGKRYPSEARFEQTVVMIPVEIAGAYGLRFQNFEDGVSQMFTATLHCNEAIAYLEQIRELYASEEAQKKAFEELIGRYVQTRVKIQNLVRSWRRYANEPREDERGRSFRNQAGNYGSDPDETYGRSHPGDPEKQRRKGS